MNYSACLTGFLKDFFSGIGDSILGVLIVNEIDERVNSEQRNVPKKSSNPKMSTLARKRAEKQNLNTSSEENTVLITKQIKSVSARLMDCCVTNGILGFLAYAIAFHVIKPGLKYLYSSAAGDPFTPTWARLMWWITCNFYFALVLLFTKALNLLWFQDIAEVSYRKVRGRPQMETLGLLIADLAFTLFLETLFVFQAVILSAFVHQFMNRAMSEMLYLFHMILLQSLYTFEYKWFQMGWTVNRRMEYIENHYPYFLGFGLLPGCVIYFVQSYYASTFLVALFFPFLIVSANEAKTVPTLVSRPIHVFHPVGQLTDTLLQYSLKYKSQYVSWLSPLVSLLSKFLFKLFSKLQIPACYVVMCGSVILVGFINLCKSHKIATVVITSILVLVVTYSVALDLKFSSNS